MVGVGSKCKPINIGQVREWFIQTAKNIAYDYEHGFDVIQGCRQVEYTRNCPYKM